MTEQQQHNRATISFSSPNIHYDYVFDYMYEHFKHNPVFPRETTFDITDDDVDGLFEHLVNYIKEVKPDVMSDEKIMVEANYYDNKGEGYRTYRRMWEQNQRIVKTEILYIQHPFNQ